MPPLLYFMMNFVSPTWYDQLSSVSCGELWVLSVSAENQNKLIKSKEDYPV